VVAHASGEEVLRLRSLFAERADITGGDLFLKGEGFKYDDYYRENEVIDHGKLGPGDFLELLKVVALQHHPLYPVVSHLMASIREAKRLYETRCDGGQDDDRVPYFFTDEWIRICGIHNISKDSQRDEIAFVALLFAYLEYLHALAHRRFQPRGMVDAIRAILSSHENFPARRLKPGGHNGGYKRVIETEFKKGRLRPGHRVAGIEYWRELDKRYGVKTDLPDCLQ
jgi:hypothetical protein